jgi:hypothetical protein
MQEHSSSTSQVLLDVLKILAVPLAAIGGYLGSWLQNRKKLQPELRILDANAAKTEAEARKTDGETLDRAYDRIDELVLVNYQLRKDCLELQKKLDIAEMREKLYDEGRRNTKALLDLQETKDTEIKPPSTGQSSSET